MIQTADELGIKVVPYTINRLNTQDQLDALGTDGVITDYVRDLVGNICRCRG